VIVVEKIKLFRPRWLQNCNNIVDSKMYYGNTEYQFVNKPTKHWDKKTSTNYCTKVSYDWQLFEQEQRIYGPSRVTCD